MMPDINKETIPCGDCLDTRITITLPIPPKALSPNARVFWALKARATRAYRETAYALTRSKFGANPPPRWHQATAKATFYFRTNRRRDRDNLLASLKAAFDGVTDAGLIQDDAGLTHLPVEIVIEPGGQEHVKLTVERP